MSPLKSSCAQYFNHIWWETSVSKKGDEKLKRCVRLGTHRENTLCRERTKITPAVWAKLSEWHTRRINLRIPKLSGNWNLSDGWQEGDDKKIGRQGRIISHLFKVDKNSNVRGWNTVAKHLHTFVAPKCDSNHTASKFLARRCLCSQVELNHILSHTFCHKVVSALTRQKQRRAHRGTYEHHIATWANLMQASESQHKKKSAHAFLYLIQFGGMKCGGESDRAAMRDKWQMARVLSAWLAVRADPDWLSRTSRSVMPGSAWI